MQNQSIPEESTPEPTCPLVTGSNSTDDKTLDNLPLPVFQNQNEKHSDTHTTHQER